MMRIGIRRINPAARLPEQAHPGDAGMDVFSTADVTLEPGARALVPTGIVLELPPMTEAQVRPRSGLALKHGITVLNAPGTIDQGYRGEVGVILVNLGAARFRVEKGMKIAQLVFAPVTPVACVEVAETSETARGADGFGSSGM